MNNQHWHIIGLGWLGVAIAEAMVSPSRRVSGTTRNKEKAELLRAKFPDLEVTIWNSETEEAPHIPPGVSHLFIAIPPSGSAAGVYAQALTAIIQQLKLASPQAKLIFTSSTSVYSDWPGVYHEESNLDGHGSVVIQTAEKTVKNLWKNLLIIRLSGLAGYGRVPGRFFAGKPVDGNKMVNLIHRDDIVSFILHLESKGDSAIGVVNLTCPIAVTRKALYTLNSQQYGFVLPRFEDGELHERRITSIRSDLFQNFVFKYQTPLEFPVETV